MDGDQDVVIKIEDINPDDFLSNNAYTKKCYLQFYINKIHQKTLILKC